MARDAVSSRGHAPDSVVSGPNPGWLANNMRAASEAENVSQGTSSSVFLPSPAGAGGTSVSLAIGRLPAFPKLAAADRNATSTLSKPWPGMNCIT